MKTNLIIGIISLIVFVVSMIKVYSLFILYRLPSKYMLVMVLSMFGCAWFFGSFLEEVYEKKEESNEVK